MPSLEQCRRSYAEHVQQQARVPAGPLIEAFAKVRRERFVGAPPWHVTDGAGAGFRITEDPCDLYRDVLVVLKSEQGLNNGQPSALAHWIDALRLQPGERVFHVGCGTGYYTAILAEIVGPNGSVVAVEVEADLALQAAANLRDYPQVAVHHADGAAFDPGACDGILINAGVTHPSRAWLSELKPAGRMILPLTVPDSSDSGGSGVMLKVTRHEKGFPAEIVSRVGIYSSPSVRDPSAESQLFQALESGRIANVGSVRIDSHERERSCLVHTAEVCLSGAPPA